MSTPQFPTIFRGYDPTEVDRHLATIENTVDSARQEVAQVTVELTKVTQDNAALAESLTQQKALVAELEARNAQSSSPTFANLGERIGSMLTLADEEAASIRESATADADEHRRLVEESAASVRIAADRYAEEVRQRADVAAAETVGTAKLEASSMLDDAGREASARREEAEAYFEGQRARAAAAAADFESTLQERRGRAAQEFMTAESAHEARIAELEERADVLAREAEEQRKAHAAEAVAILDQAKAEASAMVTTAKEQAERIRRDSERELAAATARRDSITAQLSNVRNMLATLGGASALGQAGFGDSTQAADAPAAPAPATDEQVVASDAAVETEVEQETTEEVADTADSADSADSEATAAEVTADAEPEPELATASDRKASGRKK